MKVNVTINGQIKSLDVEKGTPLLWVIRDDVGLTGTKFGCGGGYCGACTVHINGEAMRSCRIRVGDVENAIITTIEGLDPSSDHPVQQAWIDLQVPQCGYCQSGQIMQAAALLAENNNPSEEDIEITMRGNLCRCMTYQRIKDAIKKAGKSMRERNV
jgi:isoquinoline 1-oxidoreductase alpha subunit